MGFENGERKVNHFKIRAQIDLGPNAANSIAVDKSGRCLAVGCDNNSVRMLLDEGDRFKDESSSAMQHVSSVLGVGFEYNSKVLVSVAEGNEIKFWS